MPNQWPTVRSRALFSSWMWWRPWRLLIDAGDGVSDSLGPEASAIRTVAITHLHSDHQLGLPALLSSRQPGSLQTGGPLQVLVPAGDPRLPYLEAWIASLGLFDRSAEDGDPALTWTPVRVGDRIDLDSIRQIRAFEVTHAVGRPCLGYVVSTSKQTLKSTYRGLSGSAIRDARAALGDEAVMESVRQPLLVHTGDAAGIPDRTGLYNAQCLVADCTFLSVDDRDTPSHWALDEVLELATELRPAVLALQHVSGRYNRQTLVADIQQRLARACWTTPTVLIDDRSWTPLTHADVP